VISLYAQIGLSLEVGIGGRINFILQPSMLDQLIVSPADLVSGTLLDTKGHQLSLCSFRNGAMVNKTGMGFCQLKKAIP
jgi:hypothetical protein